MKISFGSNKKFSKVWENRSFIAIQVTHESSFNVCSKRCDQMSVMKIDPNLSPIETLLLTHYFWHIIIDFIDSHSYKRIAIIVIISNFLLIEKKKFIKQIVEKFTKTFIPIIKCFEWTLRPFPRLSVLDIHAIISIRHFIDY